MPDIALYYPYTHGRDESWLKAAALYLPKLALLAPRDYPFRLSPTAQVLRSELDFLVEVDPVRRAHAVSTEFLELLNRDAAASPRATPGASSPKSCMTPSVPTATGATSAPGPSTAN
jgi:hypothetical protein